jgi:hypothetical protein
MECHPGADNSGIPIVIEKIFDILHQRMLNYLLLNG